MSVYSLYLWYKFVMHNSINVIKNKQHDLHTRGNLFPPPDPFFLPPMEMVGSSIRRLAGYLGQIHTPTAHTTWWSLTGILGFFQAFAGSPGSCLYDFAAPDSAGKAADTCSGCLSKYCKLTHTKDLNILATSWIMIFLFVMMKVLQFMHIIIHFLSTWMFSIFCRGPTTSEF